MSTKRLCVDTGERRPEGGLAGRGRGLPPGSSPGRGEGPAAPARAWHAGLLCSAGAGSQAGKAPGGGGGSPNEGSVEVARAGQGGVKAATAPGAGPAGARPVAEQLRNLFS